MTTLRFFSSRSPSRLAALLIPLVSACFALSPMLQAQDKNTRLGFQALDSNGFGDENTAIGFKAMHDNRHGELNTATGIFALTTNIGGKENTATGSDGSAFQQNRRRQHGHRF